MNTIELAHQPFLQNVSPARSGNVWLWFLIGLALFGATIAYANCYEARTLTPPETPPVGD